MAGSGTLVALGSKKGLVALAITAVVAGGAVAGGFLFFNQNPTLAVVQRSASTTVAAHSDAIAIATCLSHETTLSGGFALSGQAYATSSTRVAPGAREWAVGAYNPTDAGVTLTAYVVCVNAKVSVTTGSPTVVRAFSDRAPDKLLNTDTDLTTIEPMKNWFHKLQSPACSSGTLVGFQFQPTRSVSWLAVAPVPLTALVPIDVSRSAVYANSGTDLSWTAYGIGTVSITQHTRVRSPQPPEWNYALQVFPECAQFAKSSLVSATVDVPAGGSADAALTCPGGSHPVGGGFDFSDHHSFGYHETIPAEFIDDRWLFASVNAPARGEPSGSRVKAWHVTGVSQQTAGAQFDDTAWWHRAEDERDVEYLYLNRQAVQPADQLFRAMPPVPAQRPMVARAVCATIKAPPIAPPRTAEPILLPKPPVLPPAIDFAPTGAPPTAVIVIGSPTIRTPEPTPTPAITTPAPSTTTTPPQAPSVTINQPTEGGQICAGASATFDATARRRPGNQLITDAQHTVWRITDAPGGGLTLGQGASGTFQVSPNLPPNQQYTIAFTATDPVNGLKTTRTVKVWIVPCG